MNKLFSKVLVGVAGFAMAFGLNALAAGEIKDLKAVVAEDKTAVTVSGSISGSEDEDSVEATILVVEQGVSLATVEDAQIRYIDQETAQSGAFSFDFKLETGKIYDVYCGGTDVTAPEQTIADLTSSGKLKIVGVVSLLRGADATKVTVAVGTDEPVAAKAVVEGDEAYDAEITKAAYETEVAGAGEYTVVVGRPGYLYKTISVTVANENVTIPEFDLLAGDVAVTETAGVNLSDLTKILENYKKDDIDAVCDLNDDGEVNLTDLTGLLANYKVTY